MCHHIDYGCERHAHHSPWGRPHHHGGCCCVPGYAQQQFATREEVIRELEEYVKNLQAEVKGLGERIAELRKES